MEVVTMPPDKREAPGGESGAAQQESATHANSASLGGSPIKPTLYRRLINTRSDHGSTVRENGGNTAQAQCPKPR